MKKVVTVGVAACSPPWARTRASASRPRPRCGELRIVDKGPLNWALVTQVFEHLIEHDADGKLVPRLATGLRWLDEQTLEMKLRRGVSFQNGEAFDAEIVKLNWEENTKLILYSATKAVQFVPYASTFLMLHETGVTDQHWSVRTERAKQKR